MPLTFAKARHNVHFEGFATVRALAFATLLLSLLLGTALVPAPATAQPLEPPTTGSVEELDRALARLATHRRLLVIAAHPDDEDTSLLALVSRGMGGEAAYLSLSRGEGGQNLIGSELGVGLGLVRTGELLSARSIDGARQFFSRAYDFGYTRSLEETLDLWPREVLHQDVARVIRRFRPQVVVSVFPGVPVPTHGQHQAAGVVAHEVFRTVGEAGSFPQLDAQGLPPWQPQALYRSTWFDPDSTTLELPIGRIDPLTGKSIFQLAMASRSRHRSQDMGLLQPLGSRQARLGWVQGAGGEEAEELFAGIDTRLEALVSTLPGTGAAGEARERVAEHLRAARTLAAAARRQLTPLELGATAPALAEILDRLRRAHRLLRETGWGDEAAEAEGRAVARLVEEKAEIAEEALVGAAGVAVDAFADRETLVAGETFEVTAQVWNAGGRGVAEPVIAGEIRFETPGWRVEDAPPEEEQGRGFFGTEPTRTEPGPLAAGDLYQGRWSLTVAPDAPPTVPYFLHQPLRDALYDWSEVAPEIRGEPFAPPPVRVHFRIEIGGVPVELERQVVWRFRDQARGEVRRPLRVVPVLEVAPAESLLVWPTARTEPRSLEVTLTAHRNGLTPEEPLRGRLEVVPPPGWPAVEPVPFELGETASPQTVTVELAPPETLELGRHPVRLEAVSEGDGQRFDLAVPLVDYEHIRPAPWPRPATLEVSAADLELPRLERLGYVRGASDRVPEMLKEVGLPVEIVTPEELLEGELDRFDALVIGSRAYEAEPTLARANSRLLEYVHDGGLLVVQYQQYQFARGGFAPYPLEISRPHGRVTDETAPVTVLEPGHPVFTRPNPIGQGDWRGWVQERGLYFAGTWDEAYTPLLEMADPGMEEPLRGALLVAPLGAGTYVYTGLAFFRQLPAGVPGAYRLFANLLALAEAPPGEGTTKDRAMSPGGTR